MDEDVFDHGASPGRPQDMGLNVPLIAEAVLTCVKRKGRIRMFDAPQRTSFDGLDRPSAGGLMFGGQRSGQWKKTRRRGSNPLRSATSSPPAS
jgi:hypothetical protein